MKGLIIILIKILSIIYYIAIILWECKADIKSKNQKVSKTSNGRTILLAAKSVVPKY